MSVKCCFLHTGMVESPMAKKVSDPQGTLNLRGIPRSTLFRLKMAAAAEEKTVKDLILDLIEGKLHDLEKQGRLPKKS